MTKEILDVWPGSQQSGNNRMFQTCQSDVIGQSWLVDNKDITLLLLVLPSINAVFILPLYCCLAAVVVTKKHISHSSCLCVWMAPKYLKEWLPLCDTQNPFLFPRVMNAQPACNVFNPPGRFDIRLKGWSSTVVDDFKRSTTAHLYTVNKPQHQEYLNPDQHVLFFYIFILKNECDR